MLTRAQVLKRFGLPDSAAFEMKPVRVDNLQRIRVSHEGVAVTHMSIGSLSRLADEIRPVDPDLAERIQACLKEVRRTAENSK